MNRQQRKTDILSLSYVGLSLGALCLLAVLTFNTSVSTTNFARQKQLIGLAFGAICILGSIAGISPSRCSSMIFFKEIFAKTHAKTDQTYEKQAAMTLRGHHPTCSNFSSHVLEFGGETYCAGCAGLVAGAAASLVGSFLCFFGDIKAGDLRTLVFWLGSVLTVAGLFQYSLLKKRAAVHFSLNVMFVLGSFFLLVGAHEIKANFALDLYVLAFSMYLILTRIALSQLEHKKICVACGLTTCSYSSHQESLTFTPAAAEAIESTCHDQDSDDHRCKWPNPTANIYPEQNCQPKNNYEHPED